MSDFASARAFLMTQMGGAASRAKEGQVRAGIGADSHQIAGFAGNIADLQQRLSALESSLAVERSWRSS